MKIVTPKSIKAIGQSIILERLAVHVGEVITQGGIVLTTDLNEDDNLNSLGVVLSVGEGVTEIKEGDYLMFRAAIAFGLPNGLDKPVLFRIEKTAQQILGKVKKADFDKVQHKGKIPVPTR